MTAIESAHAKINLYLHVTGRRPDGYHLLDSLAVFAGAADTLHYEPSTQPLTLRIEGPFGSRLGGEATDDNLVMRAARCLAAEGKTDEIQLLRGRLILEKNLPVASGIGGGSADAAATLRLLNAAWSAGVSQTRLMAIAETLGADVPVCVGQTAARMSGIGETLETAPILPECGLMLVNCGVGVSTPAVFKTRDGGFTPTTPLPRAWHDARAMVTDLAALRNDLEQAACALCPPIRDVLAAIDAHPNCLLARMSGSGATCFGLFESPDLARQAARALSSTRGTENWWIWAGGLAHGRLPTAA